ncbi:MAG TPA: right-handed parallel beta-helix repeat-containing protein [Burkholderiales bacterium]|nr:right-handed parallel beta-helix repeat-containing protein [Burkholderiales bacterium]
MRTIARALLGALFLTWAAIAGAASGSPNPPASAVYFKPSGSSTIARPVSSRLDDSVSALDFMTAAQIADVRARTRAVDVSAALQAFLTHCAATSPNRGCYLPAGAYNVGSTTLTVDGSIKLYGDGNASGLYWTDSLAGAGIEVTEPNVIFEDFILQKPTRSGSAPAATVIGIDVQTGAHTFTARNVRVGSFNADTYQGWYTGIKLTEWTHNLFGGAAAGYKYGLHSYRANAVNLHGGDYSAQHSVDGAGVFVDGGVVFGAFGSNVEGLSAYGFYVTDGGGAAQGHGTIAIHGNYIEGQGAAHIYILGTTGADNGVKGVSIIGNLLNGGGTAVRGVQADYVKGLTFDNNLVLNQTTYGIDIGANVTHANVPASNVVTSTAGGGYAARNINASATGIFGDGSTVTLQGYAVTSSGVIRSTNAQGFAIGGAAGVARVQHSGGLFTVLDSTDGTANIQVKHIVMEGGVEPTCNSTNRGTHVVTRGGAGVADIMRVCKKDSADAYVWQAVW